MLFNLPLVGSSFKKINDIKRDIVSGMYADVELPKAGTPNQTPIGSKMDEIMGIAQGEANDPQYT